MLEHRSRVCFEVWREKNNENRHGKGPKIIFDGGGAKSEADVEMGLLIGVVSKLQNRSKTKDRKHEIGTPVTCVTSMRHFFIPLSQNEEASESSFHSESGQRQA